MTRRAELPQSPRHVMIFDEDWEFLEARYGRSHRGPHAIGTSAAIRKLVHHWCQRMRDRERQEMDGAGAAGPPGEDEL